MWYLVCSIFLVSIIPMGVINAQERGIGVSPGNIEIAEHVDWPYTTPIVVTNFSEEQESFEVFFEKPSSLVATASPGIFSLDSGASKRVLLTFENPITFTSGFVKVLSKKTDETGFTTGTGVKVPFQIERQQNEVFSASAKNAFGPFRGAWFIGAGLIFATILILWQIASIVQAWIFNSNKQ